MRSARVSITVVALLAVPAAAADPPPEASLTDAVREAVAGRLVEDASHMGDRAARAGFRDVAADGAVLVGLDVALARRGDVEIPYAVRPIYRRGDREWTGGTAGNAAAKEVRRSVRVAAKPGYAVGGLWVRGGAALDRICLVYFRVRDGGLDPADSDTSAWVGTSDGGAESYIDGRGQPIVGLFADTPQGQVRSLGMVCAQVPPAKPRPAAQPAKTPDPAERPGPPAEPDLRRPALADEAPKPDEGEDRQLALILLAVAAIVGIPAGLFALAALTAKPRVPPPLPEQRRRPKSPRPAPVAATIPLQMATPPGEPVPPVTAGPVADEAVRPAVAERPELARRLQPHQSATAPAPAARDLSPPAEHPPFFLVRATYRSRFERMSRIYIVPGELLVVDAGPGADVNETAGFAAAAVTGGGVIGGLVGGAVGTMVADSQKAKAEALQLRLNRLDLPGLLKWADEGGNARVRLEDLVGVSIEPPGAKKRSRGVGTFRFRDVKRGEFTFEFLSGAEIWVAVDLLRRAIGPALHLGTGWDPATAVYLAGVPS